MTDPDFLGLRDEDLTDAQREQLSSDPVLRARHEAELGLGAQVHALIDRPVRRRAPREASAPRWPVMAAGLAMAAGALLTVGLRQPASTLTPRGMGDGVLSVRIDAVETTQRRPLKGGDRLGAGEAVAFRVQTSQAGTVRITEDGGTVVYPPSGSWSVDAGQHWLGGAAAPLQWTTDAGAGAHHYRVELCVSSGECVSEDLELVWSSEP